MPKEGRSLAALIEAGDAAALRERLANSPDLADAEVEWTDGRTNRAPALHLVCDAVFRKLASEERGLEMAAALLEAGADPDPRFAKSGDTLLISAASLGAELVGLRLLDEGVDVSARGLFKATALHWCAIMGLDRLAAAVLEIDPSLEIRDEQYGCTPLEWALHGWLESCNGYRDRLPAVARVLIARGATVPEGVGKRLVRPGDGAMREALGISPEGDQA